MFWTPLPATPRSAADGPYGIMMVLAVANAVASFWARPVPLPVLDQQRYCLAVADALRAAE